MLVVDDVALLLFVCLSLLCLSPCELRLACMRINGPLPAPKLPNAQRPENWAHISRRLESAASELHLHLKPQTQITISRRSLSRRPRLGFQSLREGEATCGAFSYVLALDG